MMDLPFVLRDPVQGALRAIGDTSAIRSLRSLGGGCINHAQRLDTEQHSYLLKWNAAPLPGLFQVEAAGLALLRATQTVRVPQVYFSEDAAGDAPAFILLEFLEGSSGRGSGQELLGQKLAWLHQRGSATAYGLDHNNYLGSTPQLNDWKAHWVTFFREKRLLPQMQLAERLGRLPRERRSRLEKIMARLDELLSGVERRPSLLHGDLWGGNVIPGPGGEPALIDPAVYYGDREAEIAFTELFGGFSSRFYAAYQETWPLDPGYRQRRDLYNLYHLLNHLNLFGEGYGYQVDEVLKLYVN
jgi:protein-ribulosamine 3-kinase